MGPNEYESGGGGNNDGNLPEDPDARVVKKPITSLANASGAPVIPQSLGDLADKLPGRVSVPSSRPKDETGEIRRPSPVEASTQASPAAGSLESQIANSSQERTSIGGSASTEHAITGDRQAGPASVVREPTTEDKQNQLSAGIAKARRDMARRVSKWMRLPEDKRSEQVEQFIDTFKKIAQRKANEGSGEAGNFFKKLAAQIAEIIDEKIIPGIEPFTKGVLILAFTDLALPPSLSIPLTKIIGEYLSGRIERNFKTGADHLRHIFGVLDANAKTPEEKGFLAELREKVKAQFPDADVPPALGSEAVERDGEEASESATVEVGEESKEAEGVSQKVIDAYIKYLSYDSSGPDAQEKALEYFKINPNAIEYSKEVIGMSEEYGDKALFDFADRHINVLQDILSALNLEPSKFALSRSWVLWHAAKLRYLKNNPGIQSDMDNADQYSSEDPLQALSPDDLSSEELDKSADANKEMIFVMLGWELYNALHGDEDKVEELLDPNADPSEREELMNLINEERENGKGSLSSYKLRRLGELAVDNFIFPEPTDSTEASDGGGDGDDGALLPSEEGAPNTVPAMKRKSDADLIAAAYARLASRKDNLHNGTDPIPPIDPPIELPNMNSEREPSSQGDPYYLERYDVSSELEQWLYHYQTMLSRQLEGSGNLDEDKISQIEEESTRRAKSKIEELYGMRTVNEVEIAGRRMSYIQYNVLNREECNFFGKDSLSIVVRLHLAGLLGDFTDEEIDVIRSFDSRYLHEVGTPELFQLKIGKMLERARDVDVLGNPNGPEIVKKRFQNEYEAYKSTLMELMYTLISGKVEGVDTDEASVKLSASIKKRLGELKAITKEQSFESLDYMPENLKVTVTRRVTVPNSIDNQDPQGAKVGRTMYVEHHEDVSISKAISEDLLPTLEKIESTVGYANLMRNTTHDRSKKMEDVAAAALHADLTSIPDAIAFNPYLQVAMQEYVCALGQVVAEVNNIPYSNFGALNQSGLENAEQLTIDSLMIQFPMRPLPLTEEQIEAKAAEKVATIKSLAMSMSDETTQAGQMVGSRRNLGRNQSRGGIVKVRPNELQIQIQLIKNEETRKKKRYENDIELAVKVASGLHKGVGEFWTVLDAGISNEMLTATVRKDGQVERARTFADSNSPVLDKLGKMKPFEAMRFGKDAGFGLIGVGAARYPGERLESTRWSKLGKLAYNWDLFDSQRFQEESLRRYGTDRRGRKKPDETSHAEFLLLAKDMTRADRQGMSEELGEFYKNFLGVNQLMHKVPGDIPRSGGWRIDNNDSIDQKFTATFLKEATSQVPPLAGLELHVYVMDRLRSLGGERLVVHYIGKNVDKLMELDTDDGSVLTKYNEVKARIESAIKDGSHAAQDEKSEDEVELERLAPLLMRQRDNVRIKYLQKYVFGPLLKRRPELALICERKGLTPVGERTMREQLVDFIRMSPKFIEGSQDRNAYAVLEQCLPAFEVATRVVKRSSHLGDNGEFDQGIRKYFKDVLERSQSVQILPGDNQPRATQFTPLKELLVGVDIDNKLDSMMSLFEDYVHQVEQIGSQSKLAQRFSEHVVYGTGHADAYITSPGGFDYSRIQFDGMNTLKSAISGIEGNIALKAQLEALETKLLGLFTTGLDELKTTAQYKAVVDNLFDTLNAYAESMSGNPDEANIYFGRLAQISVFSLREPVPGKNMKSIWTVGDTDQSGKGLNAEQRYNLLKALLRRRGVPDQLCILDQENMDEINPAYKNLIQDLENIPNDNGYSRTKTGFGKLAALVLGPKAPSSREKAANRLRKMRIFKGPPKTFSATSGMFLDGVSVSSSSMDQKYSNAEAQRESRPVAE